VSAKDVNECPPVDIVMVIDRSGSMSFPCTAQDENGQALENGFSVLDIVKHANKTVVQALREQDRLSVVVYDDIVDVLFELTSMTTTN
jgi:hypothetical protein